MEAELIKVKNMDIQYDNQLEIQHQEDLKNLSAQFGEIYLDLIANQ
jgi:hypothetical protein